MEKLAGVDCSFFYCSPVCLWNENNEKHPQNGEKRNGKVRNSAASGSSWPGMACYLHGQAETQRLLPAWAFEALLLASLLATAVLQKVQTCAAEPSPGGQLAKSLLCKVCLHLEWQHSMFVAGKVDSRDLGESEMEEIVA